LASGVPTEAVTHLRRQDIKAAEDGVFQWRDRRYDPRSKAHHIAVLVHALSITGAPFYPLLVFPAGGRYFVIDGHHRLAAYEQSDWNDPIPVDVFKGSLADARLAALSSNSKDKLAMSRVEKSDAAWRLVAEDQLSKQRITDLGLVSWATVGNMRRKRHEIIAAGENPLDMNWEKARLWPNRPGGDDPEWRSEKVKELVQRLVETNLAAEFQTFPDFAADALAQIAPNVCGAVISGAETDELEEVLEMRKEDATFDPNNVDVGRMHTF
jgi:hypothetical protein